MTTPTDLEVLPPDPPANVHEAICRLIASLPAIPKEEPKPGAGISYKYRSIETIVALVTERAPGLGIHWLAHQVRVESDEQYTAANNKTMMRRVKLHIAWRIYGPGGADDWVPAESIGEASDTSDKATNKATTAARKLMLIDLCQIADAVDPDHERPDGAAAPWGSVKLLKMQVRKFVDDALSGTAATKDQAKAVAGDVWAKLGLGEPDEAMVDGATVTAILEAVPSAVADIWPAHEQAALDAQDIGDRGPQAHLSSADDTHEQAIADGGDEA